MAAVEGCTLIPFSWVYCKTKLHVGPTAVLSELLVGAAIGQATAAPGCGSLRRQSLSNSTTADTKYALVVRTGRKAATPGAASLSHTK